jgi:invasion protein IalB
VIQRAGLWHGIRIIGVGAMSIALFGSSAAFESVATFDVVYDKNSWSAICPTSTASTEPCSIIYSVNTEDRFMILQIKPTSLQYYSYDDSKLFRFQVENHAPLGVSCSGHCIISAEQLKKLHADLMDGSTMTVENANLWSPQKSVNISVAEYREAFAAIVKWNESH